MQTQIAIDPIAVKAACEALKANMAALLAALNVSKETTLALHVGGWADTGYASLSDDCGIRSSGCDLIEVVADYRREADPNRRASTLRQKADDLRREADSLEAKAQAEVARG